MSWNIAACSVVLAGAAFFARALRSPSRPYSDHSSPDGVHRVVVSRAASWGGVGPGQGGDGPGVAVLVDQRGRVLQRLAVESVNQVQPEWAAESVRISPFVTWRLPGVVVDAGGVPSAVSIGSGGTDACARWLSSSPDLQRYLALPLSPSVDVPTRDIAVHQSAPDLAADASLAVAFHRVLLAFVERDGKALAAALPDRGQLTVVNTMEDLVGTRALPELANELRAQRGAQFENMMAGEDDDYADRFSAHATRPWCRHDRAFFVLGDEPSDLTFLRFSEGASPRLVAFGTAGL